jgi:hypothetical protein
VLRVRVLVWLQVCSALGQIAKHSVDLAEVVVEAEVFPKCLTCLRYPDEFVQKHAATLVSAQPHRYPGAVVMSCVQDIGA